MRTSTEGTLVMARFCNKNILKRVLLCCSPFSSLTFLSFHSFAFLQSQHELVLPVTSVTLIYKVYFAGLLLLLYDCPVVWPMTPDFKQAVHREITPVQYQLSRLSTTPSMLQYTLPEHTKCSDCGIWLYQFLIIAYLFTLFTLYLIG